MHLKDAEGIANSVDPDQTALFAQTYLSENLGILQYCLKIVLRTIPLLAIYCQNKKGYCNDLKFSDRQV